jgi:hypothetical protein
MPLMHAKGKARARIPCGDSHALLPQFDHNCGTICVIDRQQAGRKTR